MWVFKVKDISYLELKLAFLRNHLAIFNQNLYAIFEYKKMKINKHDAGHMTKMAAMPICGITT